MLSAGLPKGEYIVKTSSWSFLKLDHHFKKDSHVHCNFFKFEYPPLRLCFPASQELCLLSLSLEVKYGKTSSRKVSKLNHHFRKIILCLSKPCQVSRSVVLASPHC